MGSVERELGSFIGSSMREQSIKDSSIEKRGTITTYFLFPKYVIRLFTDRCIFRYRAIADFIVVGHSVNGQSVGTAYKVGAPADTWTTAKQVNTEQPTTIGFRKEVAGWINSESFTAPTHGAIGTGTTAYTYTQTALVTESGARVSIATKDNTSNNKVIYDYYFQDRSDSNIKEVGIFNASSSGTMMVRYFLATVVSLSTTNEYRVTIDLNMVNNTAGSSLVTTFGLNEIRDVCAGVTASVPAYNEWSDGTTTPAAGDTSLDGSNKQRNAVTSLTGARPASPGFTTNFLTILTSAQLNGIDITKTGMFTESTGNNLFTETLVGEINKSSLFKIQEETSISVR